MSTAANGGEKTNAQYIDELRNNFAAAEQKRSVAFNALCDLRDVLRLLSNEAKNTTEKIALSELARRAHDAATASKPF